MHPDQIATATTCLAAAHDGSMAFPAIVGALIGAGFEGYLVDYRAGSQTFYLPDDDALVLALPDYAGSVAADFDAGEVQRLIAWAQSDAADYSYPAFSRHAKAAGCAGYLASFMARRVIYYGRTGQCHLEHFA